MNPRAWFRRLFLLIAILACNVIVLRAQNERIVIASGAVCRSEPSDSAASVHSYELGEVALISRESKVDGTAWYFDTLGASSQSPNCWINGALTVEYSESNPEPAALALVDHLLHHPNDARLEDYVEVENEFSEPLFVSTMKSSGILQFRMLELLAQALSREDMSGRAVAKDPWRKAWVLSHGDRIFYFDPDDRWFVETDAYWNLYEKYKHEPWAEDLAWTASQLPIPSDECYAECVLDKIENTSMQYWIRYPRSSRVNQALAEAIPMAKYAVDLACSEKDSDFSVPRPLIQRIRASLTEVTAPEKRGLADYLDQIEQKCYPNQSQP